MSTNRLTTYLKNNKFYVVSPHFDDAILSMGMLLYTLRQQKNATIVNVFTNAHTGPYTLSARAYLNEIGYSNAAKLYTDRMNEDKIALSSVNARHINLGFRDALFRRKTHTSFLGRYIAELDHVYPTYRWHIIKKMQPNDSVIKKLKEKLERTIPSNAIVFAPFGIGNHVDHVITRKVCTQLFKNVYYYMDFPYDIRANTISRPPFGYEASEFTVNLPIKSKLIHNYQSQIYSLFPDGNIPQHQEKFFLPKKKQLC